ncbi:hypothetical protein QWY31_01000 [Cytophagales bacterium LB-30]|uniref:Phosphoribosylanthranilate isomerase n=1 Tax=Shiella aurantiaca TaxID=3058365 RepID=A0ABT8F0T7_9BACT|nr:hypothetical protein [Shiella aurantiaca]MDN4164053.1 hypothetical protein [Shiella aurantiaca]
MALRIPVLLAEVKNLSDARYGAGMGVEMMSFTFERSQASQIELALFKDIVGWIAGVKLVGDFGNEALPYVEEMLAEIPFDYVITENTAVAEALVQNGKAVIWKTTTPENLFPAAAYQWLDIPSLPVAEVPSSAQNILFGGQISTENLAEIEQHSVIKGLVLKGSEEIRPGYKDYDQLADILEALEVDAPY